MFHLVGALGECDGEQRAVIKAVDLSNDFLFQLYGVNGLTRLTLL